MWHWHTIDIKKATKKKVEHHHTWNTEQNQRYENNSDCDNIEAIVMDFLGNLKNGRIKVFLGLQITAMKNPSFLEYFPLLQLGQYVSSVVNVIIISAKMGYWWDLV